MADHLAAGVVEIGLQHPDLVVPASGAASADSPTSSRSTLACSARSRLAGAVADPLDGHGRQGAEGVGQRGQDGGAGGRGQLGLRPAESASGMPRSSSAVAGAGTLHSPWAMRIRPEPVGTGEATSRSTPSRSQPTAVPTMSAIESAAPTSWKWTFSIVVPWTLASASASRVKIRRARSFCRGVAARRRSSPGCGAGGGGRARAGTRP